MTHTIAVRIFDAPTAQARSGLRILLLKLDHIGDFITAIPAFRAVRHAFAGAEITLICLPGTVGLAKSTGLFDRVKGFAAEQESLQLGKVPKMDAEDQVAIFRSLLEGRYFLAADFKHDAFSRVWLDRVDAEYRAGFAAPTRHGLDIVLPAMEWEVPTPALGGKNLPLHAETRLTLLAHAITETLLETPLDADLFHVAEDLPQNPHFHALMGEKRQKIGLSTGAGAELRQWPVDYWVVLLQKLSQSRDCLFVFFGGNGDKALTQEVIARLPPGCAVDLTGALPLPHLPAYMNLLDAYIGCDTGLTHLAAGLDIPTVNIFAGISNPAVWRSRGPRVKTVYADVICAPCHLRFKKDCPNNHVCMGVIVPDIVYACFEQVVPVG